MGKVNNVLRRYFRDKEMFADLFNGGFFEGSRVIVEDNLTDATEIYVEPDEKSVEAGKYVERIRDIKMKLNTGEVLTLLALENQDVVDYTMPFRCMQYDTMEYAMQLSELRKKNEVTNDYQTWAERACRMKKTDKISPVYTLCMYHGEEEWDGPRTLKDMMDLGDDIEGFSRYFTDYPMHLLCINEQKDFDIFHTEIKKLFQAMQLRKDKKRFRKNIINNLEYQHVDVETLEAISVVMNVPEIWTDRKKYMNVNGEKEEYDMCQAMREWARDERNVGEKMFAELISRLFADNRTEDAKLAANDENMRKKFYKEYGIVGELDW